jgi:hypothetical protein
MKASETGLRKVKGSEKMGDLHKHAGWSGFNGLVKLSRHSAVHRDVETSRFLPCGS